MINFEKEFVQSNGQPIMVGEKKYHMSYSVSVPKEAWVKITFINAISTPKQGVRIDAEKPVKCDKKISNCFNIWYSTKKSEQDITMFCPEKNVLRVRNIWDNGDGVIQSWHGGGAMTVSENDGLLIFRCNSTLSNDLCCDLIFEFIISKK